MVGSSADNFQNFARAVPCAGDCFVACSFAFDKYYSKMRTYLIASIDSVVKVQRPVTSAIRKMMIMSINAQNISKFSRGVGSCVCSYSKYFLHFNSWDAINALTIRIEFVSMDYSFINPIANSALGHAQLFGGFLGG